MIRMIQSGSAGHAKAYFSDALQKSDYYLNDQELQGRFLGRLAERIGIDGMADKETFFALCENVHPLTGDSLTPRKREDRTTGYDINFHAPKSVSLVHVLSKDSHILKAFQASIAETMREIETDAMTRVRKKDKYEDRNTGELVWADFTHQTAKPVDGSAPDPHLHSHCFVFNATWDDAEKQFKAGQFRDIKRDMPYYQARFHKNLSDKLIDLGYQIKRTEKSFEIDGVPQSAIDLFSKRTNEIGEFAKEKGITDDKQKSELGARTRSKKQKGLSMNDLKQEWRKQISAIPNYKEDLDRPIRFAPGKEQSKEVAADCVGYALSHSFERASVMPERRLLATAYRHSVGKRAITLDDITANFKGDNNIIRVKEKNQVMCTKKDVLLEEKRMVDLARAGQGKLWPLYAEAPAIKLKEQQGLAVEHILTTSNQVSIIRGAAGAGKTRLLQEAVPLIEQAGKQAIIVAPSADASRVVLRNEGFENADTVARLLIDKDMQNQLQGQVLIIDEAGLLGTKDMTALLSLMTEKNARLILIGDTRQHASVVRGDALRILNTVGGIQTAEVSKIRRQKDVHYRAAVQDLSKGDVKAAFIKLSSIGAIKNVDPLKPNDALVNDYLKTIKKGKSALIVSPTHKQGNAVTDNVRGALKASGILGKKEIKATKLTNTNMTEAEKSDWRNFQKDQIVFFNQNVPKIKRGSQWVVKDISESRVTINNAAGDERLLPQERASAFDVYRQSEIALAKGDKIKITRNAFDQQKKRIDNGTQLEVIAVTKSGKIELINKASKVSIVLNKDFGHLDHAYCTTSHSAQGKTVDEVFISQQSSTFTATDAKQFYVSVSRGRDAATIYTDDRVALLEYASEIGDRQSALELVSNKYEHKDYMHHMEREQYCTKADHNPTKENYNINKEPDYEPGF